MAIEMVNEIFSLRTYECVTIKEECPTDGHVLAVMARSIEFPDGDIEATAWDGSPVEQAAILACERFDGKWQWSSLSQPTKQFIGNLLFDGGAERDKWYYAIIEIPENQTMREENQNAQE